MSDFTVNNFNISPALVDNYQQVVIDGGIAKLAPDGDPFGDIQDSSWVEILGSEIYSGGPGKGGASLVENTGKLKWIDGPGAEWFLGWRRTIAYKDADIKKIFDPTDAEDAASIWGGYLRFFLWKNQGNAVMLSYAAHSIPGQFVVFVYQLINGVFIQLGSNISIGLQSHVELRIERDASENIFTFYYRTSPVGGWNVAWGPVKITGATFAANDDLYPIVAAHILPTANHGFDPECDEYAQLSGAEERFCLNSPDILLSDDGIVSWAFDAGVVGTWLLTGASDSKSEPGSSSILYKLGVSSSGAIGDVVWKDATWQTIVQVAINAAAGNYDGYRYIHIKAQFNSNSIDQPTLTSFTISGSPFFPVPEFEVTRVEIEIIDIPQVQIVAKPRVEIEVPEISVPIKW